jgi:TrpR-related protein YerC/YecD
MAYESKLKSKDVELLFDAILSLSSKEECYRFFEDVSTVGELKALAQRFHIAVLLDRNKTYQEIETATQASTATISRVARCLNYGSDGYRCVLDRINTQK